MAEHWMQEAFAHNKGSFKSLAKRHGKTTHEEAEEDKGKKGKIGRRARLALIGMKYGGGHHSE